MCKTYIDKRFNFFSSNIIYILPSNTNKLFDKKLGSWVESEVVGLLVFYMEY